MELCHSLALVAKCLFTELVDPASIAPLVSCRLTALNKSPGVCPIGIGNTARHIIIREDVQEAAGCLQLCAGQISGIEAAVHAVLTRFEKEETEALLLVDASKPLIL